MARIIDLGLKKPDDPIFTEGIGIISIRKPKPPAETSQKTPPPSQPDTTQPKPKEKSP